MSRFYLRCRSQHDLLVLTPRCNGHYQREQSSGYNNHNQRRVTPFNKEEDDDRNEQDDRGQQGKDGTDNVMYLLIGEEIERATCLILDGSKLSNVNNCTDIGL